MSSSEGAKSSGNGARRESDALNFKYEDKMESAPRLQNKEQRHGPRSEKSLTPIEFGFLRPRLDRSDLDSETIHLMLLHAFWS